MSYSPNVLRRAQARLSQRREERQARQEALRAVTIHPAEILGIAGRVGSLEPGKDADVVIWDADPLSLDYRVYCTLVDGRVVYQA